MSANFIGGQWVGSSNERIRERRNPADRDERVASAPDSTASDVSDAVSYVRAGYSEWAGASPETRSETLFRAADILAQSADAIARDLVREEGKTLAEALTETRRTPANLRYYAGEALRAGGHTFPAADNTMVMTLRQPVGVVAAITPWNFPLNIPSRKLGPALAAGNGVIFKPSEMTPLTAERLVEALLAAGVPAGALALVHGGAETGAALVSDERVDAITFTGSTAVGAAIHRATRVTQRSQLELGGKNPMIVLADADLDRAARLIGQGAFGLSGQACTGTSRVIVHESVHDDLLERLVDIARARTVGNGLEPGVTMGPLITATQQEKVQHYIEAAISDGAKLLSGDEPLPAGCERGNFVRPTVLADVDPAAPVAQDEIFGPVLAVLRVADVDEALQVANDSPYGLAAGIVTEDLTKALRFAHRVDSGVVKINLPTTGVAMNAPFGGMKQSSTQTFKEQAGDTMMQFYTVDKTLYVAS